MFRQLALWPDFYYFWIDFSPESVFGAVSDCGTTRAGRLGRLSGLSPNERCELNRSMQHLLIGWYDNTSHRKEIFRALLIQT